MLWTPMPRMHPVIANNLPSTPVTSATAGLTLTGATTPPGDGAWVEVIASTAFHVKALDLIVSDTSVSGNAGETLLDIAVGADGSEVKIIDYLAVGYMSGITSRRYIIPVNIPPGARIAARIRSGIASESATLQVYMIGGSGPLGINHGISKWESIGVNALTCKGGSFTPGNSGAEGSWTSVGSATSRPYKAFLGVVQGLASGVTMNVLGYHVDFGFNSTVFSEIAFYGTTSELWNYMYGTHPIFTSVPTGTQFQVRGTCSGTAQNLTAMFYGGY